MLTRDYRLKKQRDFNRVYRQGKTIKQDFFSIKFLPNRLSHVRIGLVAPVKIAKQSTKRNRAKRLISESLQKNQIILNQKLDIIVTLYLIPTEISLKKIAETISTMINIKK